MELFCVGNVSHNLSLSCNDLTQIDVTMGGESPVSENTVSSFEMRSFVASPAPLSPHSPPVTSQVLDHDMADDSIDSVFFDKEDKISFVHWNIEGLLSKLKDSEFLSYLKNFDVICLSETFVRSFDNTMFPSHTMFIKSSTDLGNKGRDSGGIICLIRTSLLNFFSPRVNNGCGNFLSFIINKKLFNYHTDVLFVYAYVPPEGSKFYDISNIDNGIQHLEDYILDCFSDFGELPIFLCGDMNGRIANNFPTLFDIENIFDHLENDHNVLIRCSDDHIMNSYGKSLLDMCTALNLYPMNGICNGDLQGHFTYISEFGSSVIDYFLLSVDLYDFLSTKCSLFVSEMISSKHMPIEFRFTTTQKTKPLTSNKVSESFEKYRWDSDCSQQFQDNIESDSFKSKLDNSLLKLASNVNESLSLFNEAIKNCAENMKKKIRLSSENKQDKWFDYECVLFRRKVRKYLRIYRKKLTESDRHEYCKIRREYKNLILTKKKAYKNIMFENIVTAVTNRNDFWQKIKDVLRKKSTKRNDISLDSWFDHFKEVLEKEETDVVDNDLLHDDVVQDEYIDLLDKPISCTEILKAIQKLKLNKASGPDGMIGEFFKFSSVVIIDYLVALFNHLFDIGYYPEDWSESIILPLFKKGNVNDPNNYRGISLCNILSKLYSSVINDRLKLWIEENNLTGEYQAGFKKDYSTIDHIFTLLACVQKQFSNIKNRKLYVAFIDFQKAFDSVSRKLLWPILSKNKIHGKLLNCVKSMYSEVKAKVRAGANLTDVINCTEGVKQGDVCSPLLFSLFINELALEIIEKGRHGIKLSPDILELFILLFADDIVLLSETVVGLQNQLNNLYSAASKLHLTVNLAKSNIIVFRLGGFLGEREKWYYAGKRMEVVNCYKYLGIYFSTKLSFSHACQDLIARSKRAISCILNTLYKFDKISVSVFLTLFDCQVKPILLYGSEVWGLMSGTQIESAHLFALKRFLGVDRRTPNALIYGEFARYPIYIEAYTRCIKYWLKVVSMSTDRLPHKAYKMLFLLDERGKRTWASDIRQCLFKYGFAYVWLNQGVGNVNVFLRCFKQRIIDNCWQEWNGLINASDRFVIYRQHKTSYYIEPYLKLNINRYVMKSLVHFRLGISNLLVHKNRYTVNRNVNDEICRLCLSDIENELHILLCCQELQDLREDLIPKKYFNRPCMFKLILLLSVKNESVLHNLAIFLYKCFNMLDHASS